MLMNLLTIYDYNHPRAILSAIMNINAVHQYQNLGNWNYDLSLKERRICSAPYAFLLLYGKTITSLYA